MTNSEIRRFSKDQLFGGKAVLSYVFGFGLPALCGFIFSGLIMINTIPLFYELIKSTSSEAVPSIDLIIHLYSKTSAGFITVIIELAFAFMTQLFFYEYLRTRNLSFSVFFKPYKNILVVVGTYLLHKLFIMLWSLLFLIPGLIKSFSYALTPYIMRDSNYQIRFNEAIKKSQEMMDGYKMQLFCLYFGYFFHYILVGITLGIYGLWLYPRIELAKATFYEVVKKEYNERMQQTITADSEAYAYNAQQNNQSYQRPYPGDDNH